MGHVKKIDCKNCDYGETFSIGSTRRSHPSGGELKQCPSCDHIEVIWHERYLIELPEPQKRSTNPISRFTRVRCTGLQVQNNHLTLQPSK